MSEHQEQAALFEWASLVQNRYPELRLLFAIPNGGLRNKVVAAKLKAEGVKPGVPDIFLPVPRGGWHGLCIEMKTKSGTVSKAQEGWLRALGGQGYNARSVSEWEEARHIIECYLSMEKEEAPDANA